MKTKFLAPILIAALSNTLHAQTNNSNYTNLIRQFQLPYVGVQRDASVDAAGQQESPLAIEEDGARFELHTLRAVPLTSYLVDTRYVGVYVPRSEITIRTEDEYSLTPRTRADRPFYVDVTVEGLLTGPLVPDASKSVRFLRHTQAYGAEGNDIGLDRTEAILATQATINENKTQTFTYTLTGVAGQDRSKVRGEERFSVFSLEDFKASESQLASKTVQIWPVANGMISGIASGSTIRFTTPVVSLAAYDLYPESRIYAHVYEGSMRSDGHHGTIVPGSAESINESVPQNRLLTVSDWDSILTNDGVWTMELLTSTVFGVDRLAHVTFNVNRKIKVNSSVTTTE